MHIDDDIHPKWLAARHFQINIADRQKYLLKLYKAPQKPREYVSIENQVMIW